MKLCKDCRFFYSSSYCVRDDKLREERGPKVGGIDYVRTGQPMPLMYGYVLDRSAQIEREHGRCGPSAQFFEERSGDTPIHE